MLASLTVPSDEAAQQQQRQRSDSREDSTSSTSPRTPRGGFGLSSFNNLASAISRGSKASLDPSAREDGRQRYGGMPPVKLLDFGVSQVCVDAVDPEQASLAPTEKKRFDDSILKATGTPAFYSPEMCQLPPKAFHGRPADVWAAGVTLAMLVTGELPFKADNMPEIWRKIKEEPPELPSSLSPGLRDLIVLMLQKSPDDRPTVAALRQHEWVTKGGTDPMPAQDHLPLQISDDDIRQAVRAGDAQ